ncbi:hypothetical protein ACROYT_G041601 [Oculina patagonica]
MASVGGELSGYLFDDLKRSLEDNSSFQLSVPAIKMAALRILSLLLLYPILRCHSLENGTKTSDIADGCLQALGISDGTIKDYQLIASSAFDNDFKTYGPHRARLNMTSWAPGYRANPEHAAKAWLKVEIGHIVVITAIATQGYGDESTAEWLTSYMLLYSQGTEYTFFRKTNGDIQHFDGNHDSNTIRLNQVALPVKAHSVMLMPVSWEKNVAFRMELFGCESGQIFYLV